MFCPKTCVVPPGVKLGRTQRGCTVSVTSQTRAIFVLTFTVSIVLPPFSFGFPLQNTDNCFFSKYRCCLQEENACRRNLCCVKSSQIA